MKRTPLVIFKSGATYRKNNLRSLAHLSEWGALQDLCAPPEKPCTTHSVALLSLPFVVIAILKILKFDCKSKQLNNKIVRKWNVLKQTDVSETCDVWNRFLDSVCEQFLVNLEMSVTYSHFSNH